jgi:hypothetical protein
MLGTVFLYLLVQVPAFFGHNRDPIVDLVGLVFAIAVLAAYCVYQVNFASIHSFFGIVWSNLLLLSHC